MSIETKPAKVNNFLTCHGDFFGSAIAERKITLSVGSVGLHTPKAHWKAASSTIGEFARHCTIHSPQPGKDRCPAFTQGPTLHGRRRSAEMLHCDVMTLDCDAGEPPEVLIERIKSLGLAAVVFSTFSHLKEVQTKNRKSLVKLYGQDAGHQEFASWLLTVKRTHPLIMEGWTACGENAKGELIIRHAPMPRYRCVLFLSERFDCGPEGARQNEWRELYMGVAGLLHADVDRACHDFARLQYFPAHKPDAKEWRVDLIAGGLLDLKTVTPVALPRGAARAGPRVARQPRAPKAASEAKDAWEQALAVGGDFATANITYFLGKYGRRFQVLDFIKDARPEWLRSRVDRDGKATIRCPGGDDHSSDDDGDAGCYAVNAAKGKGFTIHCLHDGCFGRDRGDLLDLLCDEVGVTDVMELKDYVS